MLSYRYSAWDGSQGDFPFHQDDLMEELSDYLLAQGDLQSALRTMMQRGMRNHPMMGLQELLRRLRSRRQQLLDQYKLGSIMDEVQKELKEIVETEEQGIRNRLQRAEERLERSREAQSTGAPAAEPDGLDPQAAERLAEFMRQLAGQKLQFLDSLPDETGGTLKALSGYDFLDQEAKRRYDELVEKLRQQVAQGMFQQMTQGLQGMGQEQSRGLQEMLRDLNSLLQQKLQGQDTDQGYQQFRQKWVSQLGPNPPETLEELLESLHDHMRQMRSLMESLSGQQRQELQDLVDSLLDDMDLQQEVLQFARNLGQLFPFDRSQHFPFRGEDPLELQEAIRLMGEMEQIEDLEKSLRAAQYGEGVDELDADAVRRLLGEEEARSLQSLKDLVQQLEAAGYVRRQGEGLELTPRGMRKIGQKALRDIFERLKRDRLGSHETERQGAGIDRLDEVKVYEFGDPFYLDLERTVMAAVERTGPGVPVSLQASDFQVYRTEQVTHSSTVLMLDLSWSMARRGSFFAAKKVILALHNLIRTQFPRDNIYIVGFSTYARELKPDQLPYITWDQAEPYTNMQQGLMVSQKLLARHKSGNKQIIMISDGEPTAHVERGQIYLGYPPSPRTISETLREVKHCTREGIVINVFMLDRSYYLKEFVDQLTKINRGRAFYTTPEKLGQYVMVDYLAGKRRRIA